MIGATASVAMPYDWSDVARLQAQRQMSKDQCGTAHRLDAASACTAASGLAANVLTWQMHMRLIPSDLTCINSLDTMLSAVWECTHSPHNSILADSHTRLLYKKPTGCI